MVLYLAVTPDEMELPLYVTDSAKSMADWAGIKVSSVHEQCCRNQTKPPYVRTKGGYINSPHRIRKITIEEEQIS